MGANTNTKVNRDVYYRCLDLLTGTSEDTRLAVIVAQSIVISGGEGEVSADAELAIADGPTFLVKINVQVEEI